MHFILRRISSQGVEMTTVLGKSYTLVTAYDSPQHFESDLKRMFENDPDTSEIFALISSEDGDVKPLYSHQKNYLMTSDGKTFKKLKRD